MRDLTTSRVSSKVLKDAFIGATAFVSFALLKEGAVEFLPFSVRKQLAWCVSKDNPLPSG